jgi:hypothetical protein
MLYFTRIKEVDRVGVEPTISPVVPAFWAALLEFDGLPAQGKNLIVDGFSHLKV